ncbi:MAG: DUF2142 domain-containing protein [Clostridia bacterium]|nr:DUF2142 domain-containing protein [Clostridia bacterium]
MKIFMQEKLWLLHLGNVFSRANEKGEASEGLDVKLDELVNRDIVSYQDLHNRFVIEEKGEKESMGYTTMALYSPICHFPQVIGVFIGRLFKQNLVVQCYLARITNLFISIAIIYFGIKYIPIKKELMLFISLLPLTFNEIASMSADAITISSILFYISYILYLKYDKNKGQITKKDIIVLTVSSIVISQCKIVYLPLCLLLLALPRDKFESNKKRKIVIFGLIGMATLFNLLWLLYCKRFLTEFNEGVNSPLQIKYILTHPIQYFLIIIRTINTYFQYMVLCLCGEGLGSYNIQASVIYVIFCLILFAVLVLANTDSEIKVDNYTKIVSALAFVVIVALIYTSLYVQWNPVQNARVEGVQGRYFFPILLLTSLILNNDRLVINGKIDTKYLFIFMLFMNLNVVTSILYTYIYAMPLNFYVK